MTEPRRHPWKTKTQPLYNKKLTAEQRRTLATRRAAGERAVDLAAEYGVTTNTVRAITNKYRPNDSRTDSFGWLAKQAMYPGGTA